MNRNLGDRERVLRGALAVAFGVLSLWAFRAGNTALAAFGAAAAVAFGINTVTCFCVVHRALGIDTTGD
jgi:hypothetical protein